MATLNFWFEFASTYSYLSAMRISDLAARQGIAIAWHPFLLGPIFKTMGWDTSPFNIYRAKGRYMLRDLERLCSDRGLAFRLPDPFPQNGLMAARIALVGLGQGWGEDFSRAVYHAEFAEGKNIADTDLLGGLIAQQGLVADEVLAQAATPETKSRLRSNTDRAIEIGVFGAPTFETEDGELFWGDDRLEQALRWARRIPAKR